MVVEEDDVEIMRFQHCKVEAIDFEESSMAGPALGYSISLSCFDNWSGTLGVAEPVEDFSFAEGEDDAVTMTHNISAKGFDATVGGFYYSAFNNAKNYVIGLTGFDPDAAPVIPKFIDKALDGKIYPLLISQTETADRMAGTYSVSENWKFNQHDSDGAAPVGYQPIDAISISHDHAGTDGEESRSTITLTRKGGLDKLIDVSALGQTPSAEALRNLLIDNMDAYGAGERAPLLNTYPENFSVEENPFNNTTTYVATFSDFDPYGSEDVIFDPSYSFSEDTSKESFEITISGPLKAKALSQKQKKIDIEEWIATNEQYVSRVVNATTIHGGSPGTEPLGLHGYLYDLVSQFYSQNAFCSATAVGYSHLNSHTQGQLNFHPRPTSFSISENPNSAEYTLSATFNSDPSLSTFSLPGSALVRWDYNIEVQHGISQFAAHADTHNHGYYVIYDLMAHRAERITISIDVNGNPVPVDLYRLNGSFDTAGDVAEARSPFSYHTHLQSLIAQELVLTNWSTLSESNTADNRSSDYSWNIQMIQDIETSNRNYNLITDAEMYQPPR